MAQQDITSPIIFGSGYVKRFSSILGLNGSPTTVDLEIVTSGIGSNYQTFDSAGCNPGNISGITVGAFKFFGVIQSWQESYSTNGQTYQVKIVDPRIIFNDIQIITNGRGPQLPIEQNYGVGSGVPNVIDVYKYYGNDADAEYNDHGMSWNRIKEALQATGYVTVYDRKFSLQFDSNWDAPDYFRIQADQLTLDSLLSNAANALAVDYYIDIDPTGYNPNNNINRMRIIGLKRNLTANGPDLDAYLSNQRGSGLLKSYIRGKELRLGPTDVIVYGANKRTLHHATDVYPCYGRDANGRILTGAENSLTFGPSFAALDDPDRHSGWVLLENIVSRDTSLLAGLPTVSPVGQIRYIGGTNYPTYTITQTFDDAVVGYRPTENVMRAALFSKESWEAILYVEQSSIASQLGITSFILRDIDGLIRWMDVGPTISGLAIRSTQYGKVFRLAEQEAVIQLFYEATKAAAENYYGRQFLVSLPTSSASIVTNASGSSLSFRYGYKITDACWDDNISNKLKTSSNTNFRTENGLVKAHLTLNDVRDSITPYQVVKYPGSDLLGTTGLMRYDLSKHDKNKYLVDSPDMHLTITAEQDYTNLGRAIITLDQPIELANYLRGSLTPNDIGCPYDPILGTRTNCASGIPISFFEFWLAAGCPFNKLGLITELYPLNPELGLAPQRLTYITDINIPIENQFATYGPYVASGTRHGGTSIIHDDSLAPWTFGSTNSMNAAGTGIANMALANRVVMDSAQFVLAGLPLQNIGDMVGDNSNITSISMTMGVGEGLTTSYSLQTFSNPFLRISKVLSDKLEVVKILTNKIEKDTINLDEYIKNIDSQVGLWSTITREKFNKQYNETMNMIHKETKGSNGQYILIEGKRHRSFGYTSSALNT